MFPTTSTGIVVCVMVTNPAMMRMLANQLQSKTVTVTLRPTALALSAALGVCSAGALEAPGFSTPVHSSPSTKAAVQQVPATFVLLNASVYTVNAKQP